MTTQIDDITDMGLDPVIRLSRDIANASVTLSQQEARFLADAYYTQQDYRITTANQVRALSKSGEPHSVTAWLLDQSETLENQIRRALDKWTDDQPMGRWAKNIVGIGPVISAGLLANIDIKEAPTVGHIWRLAGLDITSEWLGTEKAKTLVKTVMEARCQVTYEDICALAKLTNRKPERLQELSKTPSGHVTRESLEKTLAKRPWNARLKVLTFKIGESFVKTSGHERGFYGQLYVKKKMEEWTRNLSGDLAGQAQEALGKKCYERDTKAKDYYTGKLYPKLLVGYTDEEDRKIRIVTLANLAMQDLATFEKQLDTREAGQGLQMLPPGHIHARARRWAVKIFIAHWFEEAYRQHHNAEPPLPYPVVHLGHAHIIKPPTD